MPIREYFKKRKEKKQEKNEKLSKKQKIVRKTGGMLLYLVILFGLAFGLPKALIYLLKTDHPVASITSGSMWPVLKQGDLAMICGVEAQEIQVNDIVVFQNQEGSLAIHRVIRKYGDTVVTKGDANTKEDNPIATNNIVGRLCMIGSQEVRIPKVGILANIFH